MRERMTWCPTRTTDDVDRVEGQVVVVRRPDTTVALNPTALALWELCDGRTQVGEMVGAVVELFGVPDEQARSDVEAALSEMRRLGVVR